MTDGDRTVAAALRQQVKQRPQKIALVDGDGRSVTYSDTQDRAFRIATALSNLGVQRQDPVLVLMDNHSDHALVWLALGVGAMVHVPINTAYRGDMLRYVVAHSGARLAIVDDGYTDMLAGVAADLPDLEVVVVRRGSGAALPSAFTQVDFDALLQVEPVRPEPPGVSDIASILYTSGTTGPSKGALCPHGQAFAASITDETHSGSVTLVTLPLFHGTGLWTGVFSALRCGATAVIQRGFSASDFWAQVRQHRCTTTVLVGAAAEFLWNQTPSPLDREHTLETVVVLPCPANVDGWKERFGVEVSSGYGCTEIGIGATTSPGAAKPSVCGRPRPNLEMRVVDDHDADVKPGVAGELVVRPTEPWTIMQGYHKMPDETVAAFCNLWFHTGDIMYFDDSGQLVFVDRKKDVVRRRGENISSFEVEAHLLERPDIAQVAVIPVTGAHSEDEIKAVLVMAPGATFEPAAILHDLYKRMPYFMVPRYYEAVDALPYTPTHKVRKSELREQGVTETTWDCESAGYRITRAALIAPEAE